MSSSSLNISYGEDDSISAALNAIQLLKKAGLLVNNGQYRFEFKINTNIDDPEEFKIDNMRLYLIQQDNG